VNGGVDEVAGLIDRELSVVGVRTALRSEEDVRDRHLKMRHCQWILPELLVTVRTGLSVKVQEE
jgi:hypothetical protein